jgi:DNA replication regulator SLD3
MLVPREHVLLSYIDLQAPLGEFTQSRFFDAHIKILDLESRVATKPTVLMARNETKGTVYAVERQPDGLYVLCKLGPWVELQLLAQKATVLLREKLQVPEPEHHDASRRTETDGEPKTPHLFKSDKKKRAAIEAIQSLVRKKARPEPVSTSEPSNMSNPAVQPASPETQASPGLPVMQDERETPIEYSQTVTNKVHNDTPIAQQAPESIFDTIRSQYFEALYKSKVCPSSNRNDGRMLTSHRDPLLTSPKGRFPGLVPLSIWILNRTWT